jgi:hypothetical protein
MSIDVRAAVAAALVALTPLVAAAEDQERADWSIGAGVGSIWVVSLPAVAVPAGMGLSGSSVPVATAFVERRLGDRTWLALGGMGTVSRRDFGVPPNMGVGSTALTRDDAELFSASLGLRRVVTRPGAVVEVSLQAAVEGGYAHEKQEYTTISSPPTEIRDTSRYASVTGGIVLERELTGGLGLRISTPLLGATWSKAERTDAPGATSKSVFATLAPRLELRLAF